MATKWSDLDRAEHADGRTATVVRPHAKGGTLTVLLDDGNRGDPASFPVWAMADCKRLPPSRLCPRCAGAHNIFHCPEGAPSVASR